MTTMTQTTTRQTISDQELLALEREYWDAIKNRDQRIIGRLTDEQSTVAGARGVSAFDPPAITRFLANTAYEVKGYSIDDESVRINRICDDAVTIAYGVHEDLEVDDLSVELDAFDTSVWKRTENGWTCVLHTESIKGDPYGRDRTPATQPAS